MKKEAEEEHPGDEDYTASYQTNNRETNSVRWSSVLGTRVLQSGATTSNREQHERSGRELTLMLLT